MAQPWGLIIMLLMRKCQRPGAVSAPGSGGIPISFLLPQTFHVCYCNII